MDPTTILTLAGSALGGLASLGSTLLTRRAQTQTEHRVRKAHRQDLYKDFIEEASRLYAVGLSRDKAEVTNLVGIYAKISRMRTMSSEPVILAAERVAHAIAEAHLGPDRTSADVRGLIDNGIGPLNDFGEACRKELRTQGSL
jgi:hypothetical protein